MDNNIHSYRNNNFGSVIEIFIWNNLEKGCNKDEGWILPQNLLVPRSWINSKIKEDPILVENWFDNEIIKIRMVTDNNFSSIDNESIINKIN